MSEHGLGTTVAVRAGCPSCGSPAHVTFTDGSYQCTSCRCVYDAITCWNCSEIQTIRHRTTKQCELCNAELQLAPRRRTLGSRLGACSRWLLGRNGGALRAP
jgi:hypothetical protein